MSHPIRTQLVATNGTRLNVATAGEGTAVLLMHGFPHTWQVWSAVIPTLAEKHLVIAPDLRGLGGSDREIEGYDARTLAGDMRGVLDHCGIETATVVALDAGVPPAFVLAMENPHRVRRLVLMEALVGLLPGAEGFLQRGAPWWFGFHAVPGLAETVLTGHEGEYLDFFLRAGTFDKQGIDPSIRDAFVAAYSGEDSLRCAFAYYRAGAENGVQIAELAARRRLIVPTTAIGGNSVGAATFQQLRAITDDLTGHIIDHSGHLIPLDQPKALLDVLGRVLDIV